MRSNGPGAGRDGRIVLALAILSGISYVATTAITSPDQFGLASDVYATAVDSWLSGGDLYRVSPDERPGFFYLYPPVTLLLFLPHALLGAGMGAYLLQTAINIVVVLAIALVLKRAIERRGVELSALDQGLLLGFVAISPYAMPHFIEGQVTLWLALALAVGFDAIDRDREALAGGAFAAAAVIKVFPAAIGLWLLRLRLWRGVLAAMAVGIGALVAGIVFGPDLTERYITDILVNRYEGQTYDRVADITNDVGGIRRQLAGITGATGPWMTPVSLAILVPLLALAYRRIDTDTHRLAGILATLTALLLFMPLQPLYMALLFFPVVLLIFTLESGPARWMVLIGTLATVFMIDYENYMDWIQWTPEMISGPLEALGEAFYTVMLPTDVGLWLFLLAAILIHTEWYQARYHSDRVHSTDSDR